MIATVFLSLLVVAAALHLLPAWLVAYYLGASAVLFGVYAADKSAARRGDRRTPETTLHLLALAGGWPGAWYAQRFVRHKSAKTTFLVVFRLSAVANAAVLAYGLYLFHR